MPVAQSADIVIQQDRLLVSGDLTFLTVMDIWQKSLRLLTEHQHQTLHFDLAHVQSSNSAGLALLIEWIRYAKNSNKPITFSHMPAELSAIMAAAGIEKMILR